MKSRFTSFDVTASVKSLRANLLGLRVANIYDLNPKTYLIKLAKPDKKVFLLIESGIRIHTTDFAREKANIPSVFTLKLRKHLRTKRIEDITQLGVDRVVMFTFGSGPVAQNLIVELYASENIILTDSDLNIQTLLRTHKYEDDVLVAAHQKYPLETTKQLRKINQPDLLATINAKKSESPKDTLKSVLNQETDFGSLLIEHCLLSANIAPNTTLEQFESSMEEPLFSQLLEAQKLFDLHSGETPKGYITYKEAKPKGQQQPQPKKEKKKKGKSKGKETTQATVPSIEVPSVEKDGKKEETAPPTTDNNNANNNATPNNNTIQPGGAPAEEEMKFYDEFMPFWYKQYEGKENLVFDYFDKAVDEFFSNIELQKSEQQATQQERAVMSKLEKVKQDQQRRIDELLRNEDLNAFKAQLIEKNIEQVDQAINIVRSAVASAMPWPELARIVKEEKKKGDPIANMIHRLKLESNQITLLLTSNRDEESEESITSPADAVDVDLSLTAYANARQYYDAKKKSASKAQKTIGAAENAIKAAEKKTRSALKEVKTKARIQHIRKTYWFEKFYWFITTDNYLVLAGKDMQQNEQLVKRYLRKGDLYVHADLHGASSCIIKNPTGQPVPPSTLMQAGTMSVCRSGAWNEKIVTSAYWVHDNQVSKTAPSGEYLTTGSFMIRGKKNYLPPCQLVMGFGFMFKLHESCLAKHLNERSPSSAVLEDLHEEEGEEIVISEDEEEVLDSEEIQKRREAKAAAKQEKQEKQQAAAAAKTEAVNKLNLSNSGGFRSLGFGIGPSTINEDDLDNDNDESGTAEDKEEKKKRLTAYEKRMLKKGKTLEEIKNMKEEKETASEDTEESEPAPSGEPKNKSNIIPRGKKSKLKKMKERYAEQDEEERKIRMELLGSEGKKEESNKSNTKQKGNQKKSNNPQGNKPKKNQQGKQPAKQNKPATTTDGEKESKEEPKTKEEVPQVDEVVADKEEATAATTETEAEHETNKEGEEQATEGTEEGDTFDRAAERRERRKKTKEEQEEIKQILQDEKVQDLEEDEKDKLSEIDSLTGVPVADDVLLFAIPVCAPYSALNSYKYKVKLTPGNVKRGKAAKTAVSVFMRMDGTTQQEKDLLKSVEDVETTSQMMGGVKVATPGLYKDQNKKKKK